MKQGFGAVIRQGAQAFTSAGRQNHGFHVLA